MGFIQFVAGMPNVGNLTIKFSVLEGGPTGPQVGPSVTAPLEWGGAMIGVEFPGDGGSGAMVSHAYATPGSFTAALTVTDGHGGSDTNSVTITVSNTVPPPIPPSVEWDSRLDTL